MATASDEEKETFRSRCVVEYVKNITEYCRRNYPNLETMTCVMPSDRNLWGDIAAVECLDNLGTDMYWVNEDRNVEEMVPVLDNLGSLCGENGKRHHEWLQCWKVRQGKEPRILEQGKVLLKNPPDALYVWAWKGQVGTTETCDDPSAAWKFARDVLTQAKGK